MSFPSADLNTEAKRNSGLLDECGVLIPSGVISNADRQTLVGDYMTFGTPPPPGAGNVGSFVVTYIPMNR